MTLLVFIPPISFFFFFFKVEFILGLPLVFNVLFFETGSQVVVPAGLELSAILSLPPKHCHHAQLALNSFVHHSLPSLGLLYLVLF